MTTLVSMDRRLVFVHVPKNGGISISESLQHDVPLHPLNVKAVRSVFQALRNAKIVDPFRYTSTLMVAEHADIQEIERVYGIDGKDFFVFGSIRNPWDRAVSQYVYITKHMRSRYIKKMSWRFHCCTFRECLREIQKYWKARRFRQQIDWFKNRQGEVVLSDLVRFENLSADYERIASQLDLSVRRLPHLNKRKRGGVSEWYDAESIEIVRRIYPDDITRFGYDYPG